MRTATTEKPKKSCGCGCAPSAPCTCQEAPPADCCNLPCPERPRYFCGQLLSDADLAAEQVYHREKQKLYHRALHGHGVVCGLKLSCDPHCDNHLLVGKGFAIDECGNDLVVCQPIHFDIGEALRNLEIPCENPPPALPPRRGACLPPVCYQVALCYEEELVDFVEPFGIDCDPRPVDCQATRVRETVRVKLVRGAKQPPTWQDRLLARFRHCQEKFSSNPFDELLKNSVSQFQEVAKIGPMTEADRTKFSGYFDDIRYALYPCLRQFRSGHACHWDEQIELPVLDPNSDDTIRAGFVALHARIEQAAGQFREAFADCLSDAAIFECDEPCCPSCVIIGSVEVDPRTGRLVKVCNCPRSYVWSFAHLPEVLIASLSTLLNCHPAREGEQAACCDNRFLLGQIPQLLRPAPPLFAFGQAQHATKTADGTLFEQILRMVQDTASWPQKLVEQPASGLRELRSSFSASWSAATKPAATPKDKIIGLKKEQAAAKKAVDALTKKLEPLNAAPDEDPVKKPLKAQLDAAQAKLAGLTEAVTKSEEELAKTQKAEEEQKNRAQEIADLEARLKTLREAVPQPPKPTP